MNKYMFTVEGDCSHYGQAPTVGPCSDCRALASIEPNAEVVQASLDSEDEFHRVYVDPRGNLIKGKGFAYWATFVSVRLVGQHETARSE